MKRLVEAVDTFQRGRTWLAFPVAVVKKFGDDRAGNLAALVAYYAFFSIFPLLLALVTVLAFVVEGNPGLREDVVDSALARFPVVGTQLRRNVGSLRGSTPALLLGLGGLVWAGMAMIHAAETAMNTVWRVPIREWPNWLHRRLRALGMLLVLGGAVVGSTAIANLAAVSGPLGPVVRVVGVVLAIALNVAIFLMAFRILPSIDPRWRDLLPGAVTAGVGLSVLQLVGGVVMEHQVQGASETYGTFAIVIGLLSWLFLLAQLTLFAAEINVVRAWRLWPRGLDPDRLTPADRRALERYADIEERIEQETVEVDLEGKREAD